MIHDVALPVDDRATYVLYLKGEMGGAEEQREEVDDGSFSWETSFLPAEYRCCPPPQQLLTSSPLCKLSAAALTLLGLFWNIGGKGSRQHVDGVVFQSR